MRYLFNSDNLLAAGDVTATNIVPSTAIGRTDRDTKEGGGAVTLIGPYTGQQDATIDVEIVDATGDSSNISQPILTGVGNGTMTDLSATDIDAQRFTVVLEDPGILTQRAYAPFQGQTLIARATGSGGNNLSIEVDHSALVYSPTDFALQHDLQAGTNEYIGDEWNFDAAVLQPDGTIPDSAPRLRFGNDPQVYLAYRQYKDGHYVYGFSPAPVRDVPSGAKVYSVTGSRTLTVTDSTDPDNPEVFEDLETLYDALSAIHGGSDLIDVGNPDGTSGVVVNGRHPGEMGAVELSVYTSSFVVGIVVDGGDSIQHAALEVTPAEDAPTTSVRIKCVSAPATGSERWEVRDDALGRLDDAQTNVPYSDGPYTFTIPVPEVPGGDGSGTPTGTIVPFYEPVSRDSSEQMPAFCPKAPRLGAAAKNGTFTFVYTRKPPKDCTCDGIEFQGSPDPDCLGVTDAGGEVVSDASRVIRLQRLTTAVKTLIGSNTSPSSTAAVFDVQWIEQSAGIFLDCLEKISGGTLVLDKWMANKEYHADDMIEPTVRNGYRYAASFDTDDHGTSGSSEPTFPTTVGDTVDDGAVTWTNIGKTPYQLFDDYFDAWYTEMQQLNGLGTAWVVNPWVASIDVLAGTPYFQIHTELGWISVAIPTVRNGFIYRLLTLGHLYTGSDEPTWPTTLGATVLDNQVTWRAEFRYWQATTAVASGKVINPGSGKLWECTTPGTTGSTEPDWYQDGPITDGTAVWTVSDSTNADLNSGDIVNRESYMERFRTQCQDVLAAAGIDPNFEGASVNGDGCWRDWDDSDYWWVDTDNVYLPIQTNHYYHSAVLSYDEDGKPIYQSTQEWGFGPGFGCVEQLKEGDRLTVRVDGVNGASTGQGYQPGDSFTVSVIHAEDVPFGGGQTGNDTQTWSVSGSVLHALSDYSLSLVTPNAYAYSDSGASLGFLINQGGIPYQLGDYFEFDIEGGHFKWRLNGGSWSSSIAIGTTALTGGVSANFIGGVAPSWAAGDRWSFGLNAVNGPDHLRQPTDGRCSWTGSTSIDFEGGAIVGFAIMDHAIPGDATIHLLGSDDDFATTPLDQVIPWRERNIWLPIVANRSAYRITVDKSGSIFWAFAGSPFEFRIKTGAVERGEVTMRRRLPGFGVRRGTSATIEHVALTQASADDGYERLCRACEEDGRRFGLLSHGNDNELAVVEFSGQDLEQTDLFHFQPNDSAKRLLSMTITADPIA